MRLSTGSSRLDSSIRGGLPSGIIEISGGSASGKTTLGLSVLREAGLSGKLTGLIHLDGIPDKDYVAKVGPSETVVVVPEGGEVALELAYQLIKKGARAILIDTITSVEPRGYNPSFGERHYMDRKRLLFHALHHMRAEAYKRKCSIVCLNQIRTNIPTYGVRSPLDALFEDMSDMRIFLQRMSYETAYGELSNVEVAYKVNKSLLSKKGNKGTFTLWPDVGVDRGYELLMHLLNIGKIKRSGAYFISEEFGSIGPGYMSAADMVTENFGDYYSLINWRKR